MRNVQLERRSIHHRRELLNPPAHQNSMVFREPKDAFALFGLYSNHYPSVMSSNHLLYRKYVPVISHDQFVGMERFNGFPCKQSPSLNPASSSPPTNPSAASLPPINPPACGGRLGFSLSWRVFSPACGGVGGGKSGDVSWVFGGGSTQRTRTPALAQHEWIFLDRRKLKFAFFIRTIPSTCLKSVLNYICPYPKSISSFRARGFPEPSLRCTMYPNGSSGRLPSSRISLMVRSCIRGMRRVPKPSTNPRPSASCNLDQ